MITGNPNTWSDYGTNNKSIYDPCPYGYRVPKNGSWNGFTINCPLKDNGTPNNPTNKWTDGSIIGGSIWNSTWWPAVGCRSWAGAGAVGIGTDSYYWSSSAHPSVLYNSYDLGFYYDGGVGPNIINYRSDGFAVRCVQE